MTDEPKASIDEQLALLEEARRTFLMTVTEQIHVEFARDFHAAMEELILTGNVFAFRSEDGTIRFATTKAAQEING